MDMNGPGLMLRRDGRVSMIDTQGMVVWDSAQVLSDPTSQAKGGSGAGRHRRTCEGVHELWACEACDWDPGWWQLAAYCVGRAISESWSRLVGRVRSGMDGLANRGNSGRGGRGQRGRG